MNELSPSSVETLRPKLLAVAYRMLGTVADSEDAVQDAYLRYQQHAAEVEAPEAWLVKTTTRLCIDRLRKSKREEYVGQWLPEPVADSWEGAMDRAELADSLSMAFLVLLETLSPTERATYLLREVFGYEFDEIAELLDKSSVNVRQIAARAKKRLDTRERRFDAPPERADELATRFFAACRSGDVSAIESMLAFDATLFADGGGKTHASPRPIVGTHRIANLLAVVFRKLQRAGELIPTTVNGAPGMVFTVAGKPVEVLTFAARGDSIGTLFVVLNPDKLSRWPAAPAAEDEPNRPQH
ncbi:RNA polymerase sigma-70 factor [Gemmata sp. G18]|uniref:RNA polymerase sigma-70 factor n=1 Tax=Gemmata palustris TaxID=2822762 RepID=A0ABS5BPE1_9BACT|nr:RNA polymerase sigma-70 factor [Gemmata palustris]MBP3955526.1 RNA polymerase sigma-70 factor [Gemmata palustris]